MLKPAVEGVVTNTKRLVRLPRTRFESDEQRAFVERWVSHQCVRGISRAVLGLGTVTAVIGIATLGVGHAHTRVGFAAAMMTISLASFFACRFVTSPVALYRMALVLWTCAGISCTWLMWAHVQNGAGLEYTIRALVIQILTFVGAITSAGYSVRVRAAVISAFVLPFAVVGPMSGFSYVWVAGFAFVGVTAVTGAFFVERDVIASSMREFRYQGQIVPKHVIRHMQPGNDSVMAQFKPTRRTCLCLSSDWRGFQKLSSELSEENIATLLNDYYDMCDKVLNGALPDGNFYVDWIADELFVVIYAIHDGAPEALVDTGIRAARLMLEEKRSFAEQRGINLQVDVGLAFGPAFVGLLGPKGFPKATAIGETPGRARRIQALGKMVRSSRGEWDRVIFGSDVLMRIRKAFDVIPWTPSGADRSGIRDLVDDSFYVIES